MQVRSAGVPDEPSGSRPDPYAAGARPSAEHDPDEWEPVARQPDGSVRFRVPAGILLVKFGAAVVVALIAAFPAQKGPQLVLAALVAVVLAVYGLRDVIARERLRADAKGLVVINGFARRRHLAWSEVKRLRVDTRSRLGTRAELLEIDTGDDLHLYSRYDLGVQPRRALVALEEIRPATTEE